MLANFVLWRAGTGPADGFRALVAEDIAPAVKKRLGMFVLRAKVTLSDLSPGFARFGVGGPDAAHAIRAAFGEVPPVFGVVRGGETDILGLPGPRFVVVTPAADGRRDRRGARAARTQGRVRRLAVADDPRRRAGDHGGRAGPLRPAGGELGRRWAASIFRRAATPVRRSSPARNISAA